MACQSIQLPEEIQQSLVTLLQNIHFKNFELNFFEGSSKGDNYLGIITKVIVVERDDTNSHRILKLVIKSAPQATEFRNYVKIEILHEREVFMYEHVFPELIKFQKKLGLKNIFNPFPQCYKTSTDAPYEHLIFDDMTTQGYLMKDRKINTDLDHCTAVLKTYGRYHALSLALNAKEPEIYKRLSENCRESYFNNVNLENLCKTVRGVTDKVIKHLDQDRDKELVEKINNFTTFPVTELLENLSIEAAAGQAVFCHGDCWINNILFKYKVDVSTPSEVCLLDWQLSRCASPAVDISYFIFACTDKKLRDSHYEVLLDIYHSSLSSFLETLGCNKDIFSKDSFLSHMRRFSKYGLMMSFITVPLFVAELDEIPDWTSDMQEGERAKMFTRERKSENYIMTKLTDIVKDFIRLGYL